MPVDEKKVSLARIRMDGGTQPRAELIEEVIDGYAERMLAGDKFPPVVVFHDGADYWLADGFHRCKAALKANLARIEAEVHQGTQADAQWHSYGVNRTNGLHRSNADKRRAVTAAMKARPKLSDNAIAEHVGVSHTFVGTVRETTCNGCKSKERTGADGRTIDTTNIGRHKTTKEVINNATGEVMDPADLTVVEEVERSMVRPEGDARHRALGVGVDRAYEAIAVLKTIPVNDALRVDGLKRVAIWVNDALKGDSK